MRHAALVGSPQPFSRRTVNSFTLKTFIAAAVFTISAGGASSQEYGTEEMGMTMEELVETLENAETLISQCMREAGFEYVAVDFNTARKAMLWDEAQPELEERDVLADVGFGISTLYSDETIPQLADDSHPAKVGLGEQNVQVYRSLSPADQVAYNRTLLGDNADATFALALEAEDFSRTGGCTRKAAEALFEPDELTLSYVNPLDALLNQHPRMVEAFEDYSQCIQAAGYDYADPDSLESDIASRLSEITKGIPFEGLSAGAKEALAKLQEEERAVAVASFDCEEEHVHPVQEELED